MNSVQKASTIMWINCYATHCRTALGAVTHKPVKVSEVLIRVLSVEADRDVSRWQEIDDDFQSA
jgi:hypothetical protein